jgi:C1q domain
MATINSANIYQTPNAAGSILYPSQPTFCAYVSSTITNVTGDATVYGPVIFGSELFDLNSDYNTGTGNFVAPVTGRYYLATGLRIEGLTASHTIINVQIVTSNRTYQVLNTNTAVRDSASNILIDNGHIFADMDASDTAYVQLTVSNGTKVVDVAGGAATAILSFFSGTLLS